MAMTSFSERNGYKAIRSAIQKESADSDLRNGLWNLLHLFYFKGLSPHTRKNTEPIRTLLFKIWVNYYNERLDELPIGTLELIRKIKNEVINGMWYEMFDILEFISLNGGQAPTYVGMNFCTAVNGVLREQLSAYRFVNEKIAEITSEEEIASIESAVANTELLTGVKSHLLRALELLGKGQNQDYRNSIKESISAVESLAKIISGSSKDTLAASLDKIKGKLKIHKGLEQGFKNIYGYTSDSSGIRHGMIDAPDCDLEDAKFMLVSCSTFINYLIVKADKAGIATSMV